MKYLLDTNVICETIKPKPHSGVASFLREAAPEDLFLSVLTIGEIRKGIIKLTPKNEKRQKLQLWLEHDLVNYFSSRILPINIDIAEKWGYVLGSNNDPLPAIDSLIASTALCYNLVLVTRNISDFVKFPIEIFNPYLAVNSIS